MPDTYRFTRERQTMTQAQKVTTSMVNHWWQVPLYVTPRGLSTSIPDGGRAFEMEFNFCTHELTIDLEDDPERRAQRR